MFYYLSSIVFFCLIIGRILFSTLLYIFFACLSLLEEIPLEINLDCTNFVTVFSLCCFCAIKSQINKYLMYIGDSSLSPPGKPFSLYAILGYEQNE